MEKLQPIFGITGLAGLVGSPVVEHYAGVGWAAFGLAAAWGLIWLSFRRLPSERNP